MAEAKAKPKKTEAPADEVTEEAPAAKTEEAPAAKAEEAPAPAGADDMHSITGRAARGRS